MFGQDRVSPGEDFAATYRTLGGSTLTAAAIELAVRTTYDIMESDYTNPARYDDFPQVSDVLRTLTPSLPDEEQRRIEDVIAVHELGRVPDAYADCMKRLAQKHRLGLVANIWSRKERWLRELDRVGVLGLIEHPVFSSDHTSIKPSPMLFELAYKPFGVSKGEVVFVGDSMTHDIEGAKGAGFSTVWINPAGAHSETADFSSPSLLDLQD